MKKILLSASVCMLALFAGCTKDIADKGNDVQDKDAIQFFGETAEDATRVTLGDADAATDKVPILWSKTDAIGIWSSKYMTTGNWPYETQITNQEYYATTETAATATGFKAEDSNMAIKIETPGVSFWAYYPFSIEAGFAKENLASPLKQKQSFDHVKGEHANSMFMVADATVADAHNIVKFKFTNTFVLFNVGLKGNAKIDSIKLSGFTTNAVCNDGTLDITKAPAAGSNATEFTASGFFTRKLNDTSEKFDVTLDYSSSLRLTDKVHYSPIMTLPTEYDSSVGLTVTVYATDKSGIMKSVEKTLGKTNEGTKSFKTNDIIYINLKDLNATDFGQDEPKTSFPEGTLIFTDDFAWIVAGMDSGESGDPGVATRTSSANFLKSGLCEYTYTTPAPEQKSIPTHLFIDQGFMKAEVSKRYIFNNNSSINSFGLYSGNGRMVLGNADANGNLMIPLTNLESATANLKFKFKSAFYKDKMGKMVGKTNEIPVIIKGPGNIKGGTEKRIDLATYDSPSFTEYTIIIEGATAATKIQLGDERNNTIGAFLVDDLVLTVAAASDTNDTEGAEIKIPKGEITNVYPADGNVTLGWNQGSRAMFEFTITDPWTVSTILPKWLSLKPDWFESWNDKLSMTDDGFGNQLPNFMKLYAVEGNPNATPRSVTLTIESWNDSSIKKEITITQQGVPEKVKVIDVNFGTINETAISPIKGSVEWGATLTSGASIVENFGSNDKNEKVELTNTVLASTASGLEITAPTYSGATPLGCFNYKEIRTYDVWSEDPGLYFGVVVPTEGKSLITVSFGMYLGYGQDYNFENGIQVHVVGDDTGMETTWIDNDKLVQGWNYYSVTIPVNGKTEKTLRIYPPTDSRASRANSVLLDDVKVEVQ